MKKVILITGATGTIGSATALEVAKSGATVVLLARNKSKLESLKKEISKKSGNNNIDILIADFSQISSIKNATAEFKQKYNRLDALINTAAVFNGRRKKTKDNLEVMFAVNHIGPFVLTNELLDLLKRSKPSRIITLTAPSRTKLKFDDLQNEKEFSPLKAFGASKMMNLMFNYSLARRVEGTGVSALAFFPGLVKSGLTKEMPVMLNFIIRLMSRNADKASKMLSGIAIDSLYDDLNGKFYKFTGKEISSSDYSHNERLQEKLWEISVNISASVAGLYSTQRQTEMTI